MNQHHDLGGGLLGRLVRGSDPAATFAPASAASGLGRRAADPDGVSRVQAGNAGVPPRDQIAVRPGGVRLRRPLRVTSGSLRRPTRSASPHDPAVRLLARSVTSRSACAGRVKLTIRADGQSPAPKPSSTRPSVRAPMSCHPPPPTLLVVPAALVGSGRARRGWRTPCATNRRARVGRRSGTALAALAHGRRVSCSLPACAPPLAAARAGSW